MKKLIALLLALVMVLSLAACGTTAEPTEPAAAPTDAPEAPVEGGEETPEEPAVEPVTLNVAYMPNWGALWAIATAEAKGYFAEEGITLALTVFENGPTEIAAMESGAMDVAYIGPGAHKLCSTGDAEVFLLQHLGDGDCIIGLNGLNKLEDLKGKKIGYAAGTSSETILTTALESVGLTIEDVDALSMDSTALTTAALSGSVDAVAAWSPFSLTILAQAENATDICSNVDFANMVSPGSWVVNPAYAEANEEILVRFVRAMYKAMDRSVDLLTRFADASGFEETVKYERLNYSEEELAAIDMKSENPDAEVVCPRCGKELYYKAVGNSYEVRCYTDNCIKASFRGI